MAFLVSWHDNFELFSALARTDWAVPLQLIGDKPLRQRGVFLPHNNSYVIPQEEESVFSKLSVFTKYTVCPYTIGGDLDFIYLGEGTYLGGYGTLTEKSAHKWIESTCGCKILSVLTHTNLADHAVKVINSESQPALMFRFNSIDTPNLLECSKLIPLIHVDSQTASFDLITTQQHLIINPDNIQSNHRAIAEHLNLEILNINSNKINKSFLNYQPDPHQV